MMILNYPFVLLLASFCVLWLAGWIGSRIAKKFNAVDQAWRDEFEVVRNAALTLLALLIGFSFSMAISRYDLRKLYEESEANAIGTEWLRAELLPSADVAKVRALLSSYLDQRI